MEIKTKIKFCAVFFFLIKMNLWIFFCGSVLLYRAISFVFFFLFKTAFYSRFPQLMQGCVAFDWKFNKKKKAFIRVRLMRINSCLT